MWNSRAESARPMYKARTVPPGARATSRPGPHADTRPSSDRLRVRPRGRSVSVIQLRRALLEVGHIVHILQLAWHLERAVDKPPKLVEHVTVEIAQVEALDLLREVHVVPSQSDGP